MKPMAIDYPTFHINQFCSFIYSKMSANNATRLVSVGFGILTAFKLISKIIPEGQVRTFTFGALSGGLVVGVADECGVSVWQP